MQKITSLNQLKTFLDRGRPLACNCYHMLHVFQTCIEEGRLMACAGEGAVLLLEEFPDVSLASAYLYDDERPMELPSLTKPLLMEVVTRGSDEKEQRFFNYWQRQGFIMTRKRKLLTCSMPVPKMVSCIAQVIQADECLVRQSLALFRSQLDVLTVRLPAELACENVLCAVMPDGTLAGALHYSVVGGMETLEHVAVWPQYRQMGIARSLINAWFTQCSGACRLWVIDDNYPAARLYTSMGFVDGGKNCYSLLCQK